jgi:hypothetical protein
MLLGRDGYTIPPTLAPRNISSSLLTHAQHLHSICTALGDVACLCVLCHLQVHWTFLHIFMLHACISSMQFAS